MGGNQLTSLPDGFCRGTTALQKLELTHNRLTSLPDGFCHGVTALQCLRLGGNQLTTLSDGFCYGATALEKLHLEKQQLKSLPLCIYDIQCIDWTTNPWNVFHCEKAREWWTANRHWLMSENRLLVWKWLGVQGQRQSQATVSQEPRTFFDAPWCCRDVCQFIAATACSLPRLTIK